WREQIDIGPEREVVDGGPAFNRLIGPNLWPAAQPELREAVTAWHARLSDVARRLLRAWALSLGAEEDYFESNFGVNRPGFRSYLLPCPASAGWADSRPA